MLKKLCGTLLQALKCRRKGGDARFSDEKMNVLGHEDVSGDDELILLSDSLKFVFEDGVCAGSREQRKTVITTEGEEVKTAGFLDSN